MTTSYDYGEPPPRAADRKVEWTRGRITWVLGVALPPLVLAAAGLTHPMDLTPTTAHHWWFLHVLLLPVFPLLGVVIWVLLRGEAGVLAWTARIAAFGYAVYYTGLDTLAGIAAGVAMDTDPGDPATTRLLKIGNQLAVPGEWLYLIAVLLTGAVLIRRGGRPALPGALILVIAAIPFMFGHIYWPVGVFAMLGTATGAAALEMIRPASATPLRRPSPTP
jgi:hypothetical protein